MRMIFFGIIGMMVPIISYGNPVMEPETQKVYVEAAQIAFADHGIFAYIAGDWIPVNAVYSDALGLYIAASKKRPWVCPECYFHNSADFDTCRRWYEVAGKWCGYPRP